MSEVVVLKIRTFLIFIMQTFGFYCIIFDVAEKLLALIKKWLIYFYKYCFKDN